MINCEGFGKIRSVIIEVLIPQIPKCTDRDWGNLAGIADEIRMGDASPKHKIITAPPFQPTQMGLSMKHVHVKIIVCLWFHASLIYIHNCPTMCNIKQSIYYSASSPYMFPVSTTPIIKSTQNCNYSLRYCAATSLQRGQGSFATLEGGSCTKLWPIPGAVVTVLCTPVDGCGWHSKNVEWTCRIINRLLCVASRWTIINM